MKVIFYPCYSSANPYQAELKHYLKKQGIEYIGIKKNDFHHIIQRSKKADLIHLHWVDPLVQKEGLASSVRSLSKATLVLLRLKMRGLKIIWTFHNLHPHENKFPLLNNIGNFIFAFFSHKIIIHNKSGLQIATKRLKVSSEKFIVLKHPHYASVFGRCKTSALSRDLKRALDSNAFTFLFMGMIRPYKGLEDLFDAFFGACVGPSRLLVVGKAHDKEYEKKIKGYCLRDERITFINRHIRNEEVPQVFARSHVGILPYRSVFSSGSLALMQSFKLPVILPQLDCFEEMLKDNSALFYNPEKISSLKDMLEHAYQNPDSIEKIGETLWRRNAKWTFKAFSHKHSEIFQSAVGVTEHHMNQGLSATPGLIL
ncbi:MAG: glycosyltransferase family 4 protein [Bdellovibrionota bacterium]